MAKFCKLVEIITLSISIFSASIFGKEKINGQTLPTSGTYIYTNLENGKNSTILISTSPLRNFSDANAYCRSLSNGSSLIVADTPEKFKAIQEILQNFVFGDASRNLARDDFPPPRSSASGFWACATDPVQHSYPGQGQVWCNGSPVNTTFWNYAQPDDYQSPAEWQKCSCSIPETCVDFKIPAACPNEPFGLNDERCSTFLSVVCEIPQSEDQSDDVSANEVY